MYLLTVSIRRELEEEKACRDALAKRSVPPYFESDWGKAFLMAEAAVASGEPAPDMDALTRDLPAGPRPGGVSTAMSLPSTPSDSPAAPSAQPGELTLPFVRFSTPIGTYGGVLSSLIGTHFSNTIKQQKSKFIFPFQSKMSGCPQVGSLSFFLLLLFFYQPFTFKRNIKQYQKNKVGRFCFLSFIYCCYNVLFTKFEELVAFFVVVFFKKKKKKVTLIFLIWGSVGKGQYKLCTVYLLHFCRHLSFSRCHISLVDVKILYRVFCTKGEITASFQIHALFCLFLCHYMYLKFVIMSYSLSPGQNSSNSQPSDLSESVSPMKAAPSQARDQSSTPSAAQGTLPITNI